MKFEVEGDDNAWKLIQAYCAFTGEKPKEVIGDPVFETARHILQSWPDREHAK